MVRTESFLSLRGRTIVLSRRSETFFNAYWRTRSAITNPVPYSNAVMFLVACEVNKIRSLPLTGQANGQKYKKIAESLPFNDNDNVYHGDTRSPRENKQTTEDAKSLWQMGFLPNGNRPRLILYRDVSS